MTSPRPLRGSSLPGVGLGSVDTVTSAVAPLWATPDASARLGEPDSTYADYSAWVERLLFTGSSLAGALDTVAVCGETVRVLDAHGPLLRVELPAQPNGERGYEGFMSPRHVGADARRAATHVVGPSGLRAPDCAHDLERPVVVAAGATVELVDELADDQVEVRLPAGDTLVCDGPDLWPAASSGHGADVLDIASRFVGSPYVWGGLEAAGIDCSGLVHMAYRIAGCVIPRDAHHQWAATRVDVSWDDLRPGDLVFFGDKASLEGIDHVGFYLGNLRMLHAPETGRQVVAEPISAGGRSRAVGFGRC